MDILNRIIREPAALVALLTLLIAGGSIFGWWTLSTAQYEWLLALIGAALLVMRAYLTPVNDPNLPINTVVNANSAQTTGIVVPLTPENTPQ